MKPKKPFEQDARRKTIKRLREFRKGRTLDGITIQELRDEGRRF